MRWPSPAASGRTGSSGDAPTAGARRLAGRGPGRFRPQTRASPPAIWSAFSGSVTWCSRRSLSRRRVARPWRSASSAACTDCRAISAICGELTIAEMFCATFMVAPLSPCQSRPGSPGSAVWQGPDLAVVLDVGAELLLHGHRLGDPADRDLGARIDEPGAAHLGAPLALF